MTAKTAAAKHNVSLSTIYRWCRAGKLVAAKVDGRWVIQEEEQAVERYTIEQDSAGKYWMLDNGKRRGASHSGYNLQWLQALTDRANARAQEAAPARPVSTGKTGWSNAAKRRRGQRTGGGHPLGRVAHKGDGFTEYEDEFAGGGRVQIWDES